jgi:hypothetical protein
MKKKQAVTREYTAHYQKIPKKAKSALLDEFTRLTGCHRKSAIRLLRCKLERKRPANRAGKRKYSDEVIDFLLLV